VFHPGTPGEVQPPAEQVTLPLASAGTIDWRHGLRASALGGLLLALAILFVSLMVAIFGLSLHLGQGSLALLLFLASWFCMLLGGALAVRFYRRRQPQTVVTPGMGARLGAVSGLFGFLFYGTPQALRLAFFHSAGEIRDIMQKAIEQSAARTGDPNAAQEMARNLMSPGGLAAIFTILVLIALVVFLVLCSLGGAIGASVWRGKES
jgi:hypothetical protein